jgi:hypothetical protein
MILHPFNCLFNHTAIARYKQSPLNPRLTPKTCVLSHPKSNRSTMRIPKPVVFHNHRRIVSRFALHDGARDDAARAVVGAEAGALAALGLDNGAGRGGDGGCG